jgi:hypothetical protein
LIILLRKVLAYKNLQETNPDVSFSKFLTYSFDSI